MGAQKGSELLIKIGDGASPETFNAAAGLRTKQVQLNNEAVDITNSDSLNKWRELLKGAGIKSMSVSGSGVFKDETVSGTLNTEFMTPAHPNYQIIIPGLGTFEGPYQITQLQYAGEHNAEVTWDISLESAAVIEFTAVT